ncbi:hypothetical protein R1flu_022158 [Riccia fluitans]|uniref:F-box domain-containing protein n=1 Tax=Riccia fluitans TaxID=41844 RepID=A0ABD1ZRE1_9MARC
MDPEVWKHLADHDEILRLVLARVSWDTNLRLRSVSKAWNDTLSETYFLKWSSMLTDRGFYTNHPNVEWVESLTNTIDDSTLDVDSRIGKKQREESLADPVCLLSTSETTYAVANLELRRWCKLPVLEHFPFGRWDEFTVSAATEGLLLLEKIVLNRSVDLYELDRYLLSPLTGGFVKLLPVPKVRDAFDSMFSVLRHPMIMTADKDKFVTVIALEFSHRPTNFNLGLYPVLSRVLLWRQNASSWELLETDGPRMSTIREVRNAVFAGGELFIHTKYLENGTSGHRVIKCGRDAVDPGTMVLIDDFGTAPVVHIFQHRGVLKRLTATWKGESYHRQFQQKIQANIKICSFDHAHGNWQHESMVEMPKQMVKRLYDPLPDRGIWRFYVDIEGDILCVGNRSKAEVFFFCTIS